MAESKIKFGGPEYDGAEDHLGTFADKLVLIINDIAQKRLGNEAFQKPTDIEITPVVIEDDRFFIVRAWHETAAPDGAVGVLQPIEATFDLVVDEANAYFHNREEATNYRLTTVETMTLHGLGGFAATHDTLSSPMNQQDTT